jgi:hypothetical protein
MFETVWTLAIFAMPLFIFLFIMKDDLGFRFRPEHLTALFVGIMLSLFVSQNLVTFLNGDFRNMINQMLKNPEQNITLPSPMPQETPNKYINVTVEAPKNQTQPWDNDWLKKQ